MIDQQRALFDTVYEIARVVDEEGIEARFHLDGQLSLATNPVQLLRAAQKSSTSAPGASARTTTCSSGRARRARA